MFTRRHPYLFFLLCLAVIGLAGMVVLSVIVGVVSGKKLESSGEKVGVVEIVGAIIDSKQVIDAIKTFRQDDSIKAIVLRINSPGGGVGPSQEIYREIQKTIEHKKVVASMGSVAASGGYYVAAPTSGIVANPGTITGSIGVIMGYTNFEEIFRKIGLSSVVIKSGEFKDIGSPLRPMTASEKSFLEALTHKIHQQFVTDIASGRHMAVEKISAMADGRIFSGEEAKSLGLVDRLGNFEDALQWAAELGGIEGEPEAVYPQEEKLSIFRYLLESALTLWTETRSGQTMVPQVRLSLPIQEAIGP